MSKNGDLKVWWIPQIPGKAFYVPVKNVSEAKLILLTLAKYDDFQYHNRIKPDYCNAGGLVTYEDGEWTDWYDEEGNDIDALMLADRSTSKPSDSATNEAEGQVTHERS